MNKNTVILIAEDDTGHLELIKRNLWLSCVEHEFLHFTDGQEILDFLFGSVRSADLNHSRSYILLLDIRMPKVDGHEVLKRIKADEQLRKMPVIMVTTTDNATEIDTCYEMGCSFYMVKPINYSKFMRTVEDLGTFLSLEGVCVPTIGAVDA